jgi:chromosome segregation ATPase
MTATVVTSENLAEFNAQRMGFTAPVEAVEKTEPIVEQTVTDVEAKEDAKQPEEQKEETQEDPKKVNPKLEKRFSELTKQREDARRETQQIRDEKAALETRLKALEEQAKPPEKKVDPEAKPVPAQFTDAFEYAEALADWSAENALKNRDKAEAEKKQIAERQKVLSDWEKRQTDTRSEYEDYAEVIESSTVAVSDQVRDAIIESDIGPKILYYLAKNPDFAESLQSKSVISAMREIGKLEAKLSGEKTPEPAKPVVKPSSAPAPISPIRGAKAVESPIGSDGEFHGSYAQWKESRRAGRIK